jgi:hypothetical protein
MIEQNQTEDLRNEHLRNLCMQAIAVSSALAPHCLGSARDANGEPLKNPEETVNAAVDRLIAAGKLAQSLREGGCV